MNNDDLRKLAEAATPGPWQTLPEECDRPYIRVRGTRAGGRYKIANVLTPVYEGVHEREAKETRANAALIAAANPAKILELLDTIEQQRKLLEQAEQKMDALLAHCPEGECDVCSSIICDHKDPMHFHHDGCPSCILQPEGEKDD